MGTGQKLQDSSQACTSITKATGNRSENSTKVIQPFCITGTFDGAYLFFNWATS